tara:strand:- start:56385 stop:56732 length:348 start_codon:yes stop_codon:yes gene_type:complete
MIKNKQFLSLMVFMFLIPHIICAQKIFPVKYQSESDLKVFVVDYESQADLKVYKLQYMSQVKGNDGLWYFAKYKSEADKKIYFVDYQSQSDLKIFFVKYKSQAGWRNKGKIHLMY